MVYPATLRSRLGSPPPENSVNQQEEDRPSVDDLTKRIIAVAFICLLITAACFLMLPPIAPRGADQSTSISVATGADQVTNQREVVEPVGNGTAVEQVNRVVIDQQYPSVRAIADNYHPHLLKTTLVRLVLKGISEVEFDEAIKIAYQKGLTGVVALLNRLRDPAVCLFEAGQLQWDDEQEFYQLRQAYIDRHLESLADVRFLRMYLGRRGLDFSSLSTEDIRLAAAEVKQRLGEVDVLNLCGASQILVTDVLAHLNPRRVLIDASQAHHLIPRAPTSSQPSRKELEVSLHKKLNVQVSIAQYSENDQAGSAQSVYANSPMSNFKFFENLGNQRIERLHVSGDTVDQITLLSDKLTDSHVNYLKIAGQKIIDDFSMQILVKALTKTPSLYCLDLSQKVLTPEAMYTLMEALPATGIRELKLAFAKGEASTQMNLLARKLDQLPLLELELFAPYDQKQSINVLASSIASSRLVSLRCQSCSMGSREDMLAFWGGIANSNLRAVSLINSDVADRESLTRVVDSIMRSRLRHINLKGSFANFVRTEYKGGKNILSKLDPGFSQFKRVLFKPQIESINLSGAPVTDEFLSIHDDVIYSYSRSPDLYGAMHSSLRSLDLSVSGDHLTYKVSHSGVTAFANRFRFLRLNYLNFKGHKLEDSSSQALVRAAVDANIEFLGITFQNSQNVWARGFLEDKQIKLLT